MDAATDEILRFWKRVNEFAKLGYPDAYAITMAGSGVDIEELKDRIADLERRGCAPKTAREIAR